LLRARRYCALTVQPFGDRLLAVPLRAQLEDPSNDRGFRGHDLAFDVRSATIGTCRVDVAISETGSSSDVTGPGLPHHRVVGSLASFFALDLGGEVPGLILSGPHRPVRASRSPHLAEEPIPIKRC